MSVYYVHAPDAGLVKIGFAGNAETRFSKIQSDSPSRLVLLAVERGDKKVEAARHRRFEQFRARGEWFRFEGALAKYVGSLPPYNRRPRETKFGSPSLDEMAAATGMSRSYVSQLRSGVSGNIPALIHIYKTTGWLHPSLKGFGLEMILDLAEKMPWRSQLGKAA